MDKKNLLIGLAFILAAFGLMFYQSSQLEPPPDRAPETGPSESAQTPPVAGEPSSAADEGFSAAEPAGETEPALFRPVEESPVGADDERADTGPDVAETTRELSNDFIRVEFTNLGGAIRQIHFLQTTRGGPDTFVFNAGTDLPALGLSFQGPSALSSYRRPYVFVDEASSPTTVVFERELAGGVVLRRTYGISDRADEDADPYLVSHRTELINRSEQPLRSESGLFLNLGTVYSAGADQRGEFLSFGYYDGADAEFIRIRKFTGSSGFMGIGARPPVESVEDDGVSRIEWGTVKNQFFAFVATVGEGLQSNGFFATGAAVPSPEDPSGPPTEALRGSLAFPIETIDPGGSQVIDIAFYTGPKEFRRLSQLGEGQDMVMQFGFFGFFSKLLLFFLYGVHSFVPSWGWSIVVMTIIIKLLFWPLTAKAAQSQKRMQKIQAPLKELREKYKDNPQKMQKETMRLFRENKVNPAAGCLPIFIQMPIFIGLFWMLRTASELRYAPFLWINDLSRPDTVAEVFGFPINLLPLLMACTMYFQMRMTPAMATGDQLQQKIFKFLPAVFLIFLYNFSSGLVLYWTVQNLLTILQQYITNKRTDVANEPVVVPGTAKKKARKKTK